MSKLRTARSVSNFETRGIWDDTVLWGTLTGRYFVDGNDQVVCVKRVNFTRGTVTLTDGRSSQSC